MSFDYFLFHESSPEMYERFRFRECICKFNLSIKFMDQKELAKLFPGMIAEVEFMVIEKSIHL